MFTAVKEPSTTRLGPQPAHGQTRSVTPDLTPQASTASAAATARRELLKTYCIACHNRTLKTAGLVLEAVDTKQVGASAELWEKVLRKVQSGQMPPAGRSRPDKETATRFVQQLTAALDDAAAAAINPGRPAVHRLNRTEYVAAIRDLLHLEIDGRALLPTDDSGFGFDNNADVLTISPALLERYMAAAAKISRLAIGDAEIRPVISRYQVPRLLRQEERMSESLPFGTRGGIAVRHTFPLDGEYHVKIRMKRSDVIIGLDKGDQIEVRLDGVQVKLFTLGGVEAMKGITYNAGVSLPPDREDILKRYLYDTTADDGFEARFAAEAGTRVVAVAFLKDSSVEEGALGGTEERRGRADQIAARQLEQQTQLASLELALESVELLGACDGTYACAYSNTIAWRTPTTPLPMENDPRAVFERLFGTAASTDAAARLARLRRERSILDSVTDKIAKLQVRLAPGDRTKLTEYLDAVRDVERRIQKAEEQSRRDVLVVDQPAGIPSDFADHAKLMMDLLALAYQTDLTRVSTFMIGREVSSRPYPEIGVSDAHHPISHHENDPGKLDRLGQINRYHMKQFAHFVGKLRTTPEGDGSLLDRSLLVYGAGISDSNTHFHDNLPIVLLGGAAGALKGGRHIRYADDTPLTNLWLTLLDKVGVRADKIGDSSGRIEHLWDL